jgi:hypothetical protein
MTSQKKIAPRKRTGQDRGAKDIFMAAIQTDFNVAPIGETDELALFGDDQKDLFHFVCYQYDSGLYQFYVPHFRVADAITEAAARTEPTLIYTLAEDLVLFTEKGRPYGIATGKTCFLLNGKAGSVLADRMIYAGEALTKARKRVAEREGLYALNRVKTQGGNPVQSASRRLIDGIAFEQALLGRLSAKRFGLYSAFCTHRDFPCALEKRACQQEMLHSHLDFYDANPPSNQFVTVANAVQDKLIGRRIWGPDLQTSLDEAVDLLGSGISTLTPIQRTQLVLLNGMHGGSVFLHLAVVIGLITFENYLSERTGPCQPDFEEEKWIRSSTSYIELFGEVGQGS